MRLFQNSSIYPGYIPRLRRLTHGALTFQAQIQIFLNDRYGALHLLLPILNGEETAFSTNCNDEVLQRTWAREQGMPSSSSMEEVLLAQIEAHRTEVFYNTDPIRYGSNFVRKLPGCVRKSIAWRAAPSPGADFAAYDLVVCNFPSILKSYEERGWKTAYFSPAHDPEMDVYAANTDRPIDVLFVGGYSRHHRKRAAVLEAAAGLRDRYRIEFCLDRSRLTRLAESPIGRLAPLGKHRRPRDIRAVTQDPVFGRGMYEMVSKSKIVINGAVDMAGDDRGNLRCFEAMGCRNLLLSDAGIYPEGMTEGRTLVTYQSSDDVLQKVQYLLQTPETMANIANAGNAMVRHRYNKVNQMRAFQSLVD